jgi:hypothetical protein
MALLPIMFLSVGTPAAHAQHLNNQQQMLPANSLAGSITFLVAPQVSITCGGAIGSATDGNGVPINWTFNTKTPGRTCVTVTYNVPGGTTLCDFLFYVPNRDATGDIFFHFSNGSIVKLNENPISGFTDLGDQNDVSQVTFTDVNDQTTNSVQLGWGKTASFGLKAVCLA